jgi:hypothetical protein
VTLRAPVPLERALEVSRGAGGLALRAGDRVLAEARLAPDPFAGVALPAAPPLERVRAAEGRCRAFETHPFPRCFVCGPERADGLRIFPGPVAGSDAVAAVWEPRDADPDGRVPIELLFAALDCPTAFPLLETPESKRFEPLVLGRLAGAVRAPLSAGEPCIVVAWPLGPPGRRAEAGAALYSVSGACGAVGRATWVSLAGRSA